MAIVGLLLANIQAFAQSQPASGPSLARFNVDDSKISVSGISSGGYMAVQIHIAFSDRIMGAGIIAGGPYLCSDGSLTTALTRCINVLMTVQNPIQVFPVAADFVARTSQVAAAGDIADPANLRNSRVYLFSGTLDTIVPQGIMRSLLDYYSAFVTPQNIAANFTVPATHAVITLDTDRACNADGDPYLNRCQDYNQANVILQHIYGPLQPPLPAGTAPSSHIVSFDQTEFIQLPPGQDVNDPSWHGMARYGHAYIPQSCQNGTVCRLHIAVHGCKQGASAFNTDNRDSPYLNNSGYNETAETNDIIVLYPQVVIQGPTLGGRNPMGCWDFWGYTDRNFYKKSGIQLSAISRMMYRISAGADTN